MSEMRREEFHKLNEFRRIQVRLIFFQATTTTTAKEAEERVMPPDWTLRF